MRIISLIIAAVYGFSDRGVAERLRKLAGGKERPSKRKPARDRQIGPRIEEQLHGNGWIFFTASGGVSARSGTTAGSGDATPYIINESSVLTEVTKPDGTSHTLTIYNLSTQVVAGDAWVQCKSVGGRPVVDVEYCDQ